MIGDSVIRLADPAAEYRSLRAQIDTAVGEVLESGAYILGPAVERFEREAAEWIGSPHAIGVSNGTDALVVALDALGVGQGEGDEVLVPAFSFMATAGPVVRVGARPIFVDVDPQSFLATPERMREAVGPRTRAAIVVHLFGRTASWPSDLGVPVVEDAAQAFGAGPTARRAGTLGAFGAVSFFPAKPLGAAGDAGLVLASDPDLAARARRLRSHGAVGKNRHAEVGGNYRMDPVQAAILSVKLRSLDGWLAARQHNADTLRARLADVPEVHLPGQGPEGRHAWAQFVIRADDRDRLARHLGSAQIESAVYYPIPLPSQPCFSGLGHAAGEFPGAEEACRTVLAIPVHAMLTADEVERVACEVRKAYGRTST